jgi:hypothetical protein
MVDTLTEFVSEDGRKNTIIINTSASANMSQMKLVLNHFPPLDMGVPLLIPQAADIYFCNPLLDPFLALL